MPNPAQRRMRKNYIKYTHKQKRRFIKESLPFNNCSKIHKHLYKQPPRCDAHYVWSFSRPENRHRKPKYYDSNLLFTVEEYLDIV